MIGKSRAVDLLRHRKTAVTADLSEAEDLADRDELESTVIRNEEKRALARAVRELMEYLKLAGAECTAAVEKNRAIPAPRALLFFDLFEEAAERLKLAPAGMLVSFDLRDAEQMTILAEGEGDLPPEHWEKKQIAEQGGSLAAEKEGGEFRIRLSFPFSEGGSGA